MAINFNNRNQGIVGLDLSDFGLQQPEENMTVAETFNTPQSLIEMGAVTPGKFYGYNLTDQGEALEEFRNAAVNFKNAPANSANTAQSAYDFIMNTNPTMYKDIKENKSFIQDAINKGFLGTEQDYEKQKSFADPDDLEASLSLPTNDKLAMAISNYDQLFGPKTMTDALGTVRNIPAPERSDIYTGLMDAKTGEPIDLGNPTNDPRVVSEEQGLVGRILDPDRRRGMPGAPTGAYEMIGGTPVAIGDVLGRQQALEKADFYEEPDDKKGLASFFSKLIGPMLTVAGFPKIGKGISLYNTAKALQSGSLSDAASRATKGIGSLTRNLSRKMRGVNPDGSIRTQAEYEQARADRQLNNRLDYMLDRKKKNKSYSKKNLAKVQKQINERINQGERDALNDKNKSVDYGITGGPTRTDIDVGDGGAESGGRSKVVCTMMNDRYGFGSFRNKIWMKFHGSYGPEYQKGYHAIFLPLVKIAKGEGKINTAVRKVLEHMGRHVTADMFKIMKGKKRDTLGRIYRAIFEPACHIIGKIKSALGRG